MHHIVVLAFAVLTNAGPHAWSEGFAREFRQQCQAKMPAPALSVCGCLSARLDGTLPEAEARTAPDTAAYHGAIADALAACTRDLPEPYRSNLERGAAKHRKLAAELARAGAQAGRRGSPGVRD